MCRQGAPSADRQRRWLDRAHRSQWEEGHGSPRMVQEPGMSHTSMQLFLKQLVCCLLQPFCKPPEHQPWFNSGILLGSSLTLTPAGTACAGLKGKAGAEPGAAPAFHHTEPERLQRQSRSRFPGQRGLGISLSGSRAHARLRAVLQWRAQIQGCWKRLGSSTGIPGQIERDSVLLGWLCVQTQAEPSPS